MIFSRIVALGLGLVATGVEATIAIGIHSGHHAMWVDGVSPISKAPECSNTWLTDENVNPCEHIMPNGLLANGRKYVLHGCGGNRLWLTNGDGSYNSECRDAPANLDCGVRRKWLCY